MTRISLTWPILKLKIQIRVEKASKPKPHNLNRLIIRMVSLSYKKIEH